MIRKNNIIDFILSLNDEDIINIALIVYERACPKFKDDIIILQKMKIGGKTKIDYRINTYNGNIIDIIEFPISGNIKKSNIEIKNNLFCVSIDVDMNFYFTYNSTNSKNDIIGKVEDIISPVLRRSKIDHILNNCKS